MSNADLATIYRARFDETGIDKRNQVWQALCAGFFNQLVGPDQNVLDMACGYGEFINNVAAKSKSAIDLNPDARHHLAAGIQFQQCPATSMDIQSGSKDVVFTSNFLEHLPSKDACSTVFNEVLRVLRPGGRFIVMGPNIRYAFKEYWDFYDHYLPLSDRSLSEGMQAAGFDIIKNVPRFLPFTMKSKAPSGSAVIKLYLSMPFVWPLFGKQFLIVARKPAA